LTADPVRRGGLLHLRAVPRAGQERRV